MEPWYSNDYRIQKLIKKIFFSTTCLYSDWITIDSKYCKILYCIVNGFIFVCFRWAFTHEWSSEWRFPRASECSFEYWSLVSIVSRVLRRYLKNITSIFIFFIRFVNFGVIYMLRRSHMAALYKFPVRVTSKTCLSYRSHLADPQIVFHINFNTIFTNTDIYTT